MAFMVPVVKNNFEIYKDRPARKISEGSSSTTTAHNSSLQSRVQSKGKFQEGSFLKGFSSMPCQTQFLQEHRSYSQRALTSNSHKTSANSLASSPTKSLSPNTSCRNYSKTLTETTAITSNFDNSQHVVNKLHCRLVDKLRKSFRKDNTRKP